MHDLRRRGGLTGFTRMGLELAYGRARGRAGRMPGCRRRGGAASSGLPPGASSGRRAGRVPRLDVPPRDMEPCRTPEPCRAAKRHRDGIFSIRLLPRLLRASAVPAVTRGDAECRHLGGRCDRHRPPSEGRTGCLQRQFPCRSPCILAIRHRRSGLPVCAIGSPDRRQAGGSRGRRCGAPGSRTRRRGGGWPAAGAAGYAFGTNSSFISPVAKFERAGPRPSSLVSELQRSRIIIRTTKSSTG
jgi:hypothetical protein